MYLLILSVAVDNWCGSTVYFVVPCQCGSRQDNNGLSAATNTGHRGKFSVAETVVVSTSWGDRRISSSWCRECCTGCASAAQSSRSSP